MASLLLIDALLLLGTAVVAVAFLQRFRIPSILSYLIVGVLLAWWTLDALVSHIPLPVSVNAPPSLNVRVLGFSVLLTLVTGVLFGLAPAFRLTNVEPGAAVKKGDTLIVLEAMKMELPIRAPADGTVARVTCTEGQLVQPGVPLVELED